MGDPGIQIGRHRARLPGKSWLPVMENSLDRLLNGLEQGMGAMRVRLMQMLSPVQEIKVTCLVACLDDAADDPLAAAVRQNMDLSCKIPAGVASSQPQLVVATLDINKGAILPLPLSTFFLPAQSLPHASCAQRPEATVWAVDT